MVEISTRWPQVVRTAQDKRQKTANGEEASTFEIVSAPAAVRSAVADTELEMAPLS